MTPAPYRGVSHQTLDSDARRQNDLVLDGWVPIEITWRMTDNEIATTIRRFLALPPQRL
jgi:hypothetical protein